MPVKNMVEKDWVATPSYSWPSGVLRRHFDYQAGDKPIGYQSRPTLLFTDIRSGSLTGCDDGNGAFMSLCGLNIGKPQDIGTPTCPRVYFRDPLGDNVWHEVANYRAIRPSPVFSKMPIMELIVQIGSLGGGMVAGRALDIRIDVNGTDAQYRNDAGAIYNYMPAGFVVQPGRTAYVDIVDGNDATGVFDDPTKPFKHVQRIVTAPTTYGGLWAVTTPMGEPGLRGGDTIMMRGKGTLYNEQLGYGGKGLRFRLPQHNGSEPDGIVGHGYIHITAHPGPIEGNAPELVHYKDPPGGGGFIHGVNTAYFGTSGTYVSISRLKIECDPTSVSDAAPINLQNGANWWRIVCNDIGPWLSTVPYPDHARAGGIAGQGSDVFIRGNRIRDIGCGVGAEENHGVYVGNAGDVNNTCSKRWTIRYNLIENITGGSSMQCNDNAGIDTFDDIDFSNNYCDGNDKYAVNLSNQVTRFTCTNNVLIDSAVATFRINQCPDLEYAYFLHNTCIQTRTTSSTECMVMQSWGNQTFGELHVKHNIFAMTADHVTDLERFTNMGVADTALRLRENLYWDFKGVVMSPPAIDTLAVTGDPKFRNMAGGDYTCLADGAGMGACTEAEEIAIADDFYGVDREVTDTSTPSGDYNDIGAMQGVGT